jgi:hypothetical protein
MPMTDDQELKEKLEQFGELLGQRIKEFKITGRLSDQRRAFLDNIRRDNDALRAKVESAAKSHRPWEYTKAELWRDFGTMMNELITLDDLVDIEATKKAS